MDDGFFLGDRSYTNFMRVSLCCPMFLFLRVFVFCSKDERAVKEKKDVLCFACIVRKTNTVCDFES